MRALADNNAYSLKRGEGAIHNLGIDFTVKAGERQTTSGAAVFEYVTRKGEEPEAHTHLTEDEMFYVLEGRLTFVCDARRFEVESGGFVFLPHGMEHGYTIRSDGPIRLLVITAPPRERSNGWGGFVADLESSG
jgi:mannose-6-phosphate isomerase-like protein (cupin superfamily)